MSFNLENCSDNYNKSIKSTDKNSTKQAYVPRYLARKTVSDSFTRSNPVSKMSFKGINIPKISDIFFKGNPKSEDNLKKERTTEESLTLLEKAIPDENKLKVYKDVLLKNKEVLNSLPLDRMDGVFETYPEEMILNLISSNWKSEYKDIPYEKIDSNELFRRYFVSILRNPSQAQWTEDELKVVKFGDENDFDSLEFLDLDDLKKDSENFDIDKCIDYLKKVKNSESSNEEISLIKALSDKVDNVEELKTKCPNFINYLFKNLNKKAFKNTYNSFGSYFDIMNMDIEKISKVDKYIKDEAQIKALTNLSRYETYASTVNNLLNIKNFKNYDEEKQLKIINANTNIDAKNKTVLLFLINQLPESEMIDKICEDKSMSTFIELDVSENIDKFEEKFFANQEKADNSDKKKFAEMLYILSLAYPENYNEFIESVGFQEIIKGNLNCNVLNGAKDLKELDGNFFYNYFEKIENNIEKETTDTNVLSKCKKEDLINLAELDPENTEEIITTIKSAKDPDLMAVMVGKIAQGYRNGMNRINNIQKNGGYVEQADILDGRIIYVGLLKTTAKNPELIKKLAPFVGENRVAIYQGLAEVLSDLDNIQQNNVIFFAKNYAEQNNQPYSPILLMSVAALIKEYPDFVDPLLELEDDLKVNPELKGFKLEDIICLINKNNKSFLEEKLKNKSLTAEDIYIMAMTTKLSKFDDKVLSVAEDVFNDFSRTGYIYGENLKKLRAFSGLVNLKAEAPVKYEKIKNSGIFEIADKNNIPIDFIDGINKNTDFSEDVYNDLQLIKDGKDIVPSFNKDTSVDEVFSKTKTGDVAEIGDKLFINDGKTMSEWKMTKEKYLELFPPLQRYMNSQGKIGDCYLVGTLFDIMRKPETRVKLYQAFEQDGNDINVTIKSYEQYKGKINFKDGQINLDDKGKHISGCKGMQMLEQAYAKVAFRDKEHDKLLKLSDKTDKNSLMSRISGGYQKVVLSEMLGIDNVGYYKDEDDDKIHIMHNWKSFDKEKPIYYTDINKDDTYALSKDEGEYFEVTDFENDIKQYLKENYLLEFSTIEEEDLPDESPLNMDYNLVSSHAYSIVGYDEKNKIVKIANPHNYSITVDIPIETLYDNIDDVTIVKYK